MPFPSLSPRARRAWFVVALALPVLSLASLASLAGAAAWVRGHGGLAAGLTHLARGAAFLAGGLEGVPAAPAVTRADVHGHWPFAPGGVWLSTNGSDRERDDFSFAIVEPREGGGFSFVMDGGRSAELARLRRSASVPTVWFVRDGVEYVVTDRASVERARELCEPLQEIGSEMGRVGAKQGAIGARLGRYGGRLGALGGRLGGLSARLAVARLSDPERDRLEAERAEVEAEMERVQAEMEAFDHGKADGHGDLERRMQELSKRHEEALARVRMQLRRFLDELVRSGKAERLGRST